MSRVQAQSSTYRVAPLVVVVVVVERAGDDVFAGHHVDAVGCYGRRLAIEAMEPG